MQYENFNFESKYEIEKLLKSANETDVPSILIGAVNGVDDLEWIQGILFSYIDNDDYWISKTAINLFGDLARIYGNLNKNMILEKFKKIKREDLKYVIDEAIEDIEIYSVSPSKSSNLEE